MTTLIIFAVSFGLSAALTPAVRAAAIRRGWIDRPSSDRWHRKPTALMGGIAIYLAMGLPLMIAADVSAVRMVDAGAPYPLPVPPGSLAAVIWIGATILFFLGLVDDIYTVKPYTKLVGQILVASLAAFFGFRLGWFHSLTLDTMVTIVWIVGITNAFNLLDNMDGLSAGVGLIAALYLAWLFAGNPSGAGLAALMLAGALAGFLLYNTHPASIFMGDCGSLVIGYTLSMLTLHYAQNTQANALSPYAVPVMLLMVPILDTTLVTFIRLLSGRKASVGGRDHTSHRLVLVGFSERGAVFFLYGVGAISGIAAIFVSQHDTLTSPAVIIPLLISVLLMGIYLAQLRVYPEKEFSLLRDRPYTPVLIELTYKRQMALVVLDFCIIAFSYYLSYRLRFSGEAFIYYFKVFLHSLPAVIACKLPAFYVAGIYRGFWRFLSTDDVFSYLKASTLATLLSVAAVTFIFRFQDFSKGIFLIDFLLTTGLLLGTRGSFRISLDSMKRRTRQGEAVLIYGAGRGGEILLREILNNDRHRIRPVGFIDDDPLKRGKKLQGYPILGDLSDLGPLHDRHRFTGVLVSFTDPEADHLAELKRFCLNRGLFLRRFSIHLEPVELEG